MECRLCAFADEADTTLDGQIKALTRNNINFIELRGVDGENVSELKKDKAAEVRKRLFDEGISVWSVGSPAGKVKISEPFTPELERFRRLVDTSVITGAKCLRIFSFYGTDGKPEFRDEVLYRLLRFTEEARDSGIILCHENEKGIYGDNAARCAEIHRALPGVKAVFDPANFVQCGQDTLAAWETLEPYVYYGHIKDADKEGHVVPPGMGAGHIADYLPGFFNGERRVLTVEPHLSKFVGLASLEKDHGGAVGGMSFTSSGAAFDYAVAALRKILEKIGIREE